MLEHPYKISPPFPSVWKEQRKKNGSVFFHFEHIKMDSVYSGHLAYNGDITLYKMITNAQWQPINTFTFHKKPDSSLLGNEGYDSYLHIRENTVAAYSSWFLDMRNKIDDKPTCTGRICIYEISPDGKHRCVFQMEAWEC